MKDQSPEELGLVLMLASDTSVRELVLNGCVTEQEKCVVIVQVNDSLPSWDFC